MSDYMFMLESHLTPAQRDAVTALEKASSSSAAQIFLVGGAMRDMLGGFPISDLDFAVQGNAAAVAKKVVSDTDAEVLRKDTLRNSHELVFPGGVTVEIAATRTEAFAKPGAKPKVSPATIYQDLCRRDFTMNSIALSLNPASRGLLLDPMNGAADIERRELRTNSNGCFYDDPVRMLRLLRFRVRLGFDVDERTQLQYQNARDAEMENHINDAERYRELVHIANEASAGALLSLLENENLLQLFSPLLKGSKVNHSGLSKLEKARQLIPHGVNLHLNTLGIFLHVLTEKLSTREKREFAKKLGIPKADVDLWQKLEARSQKLSKDLASSKLHRTSELYFRLVSAPGDEILYLYLYPPERLVHDRIRSFLQKHIFTVMEITDRDAAMMAEVEVDDPDLPRLKHEIIVARLDGRKWKPKPKPKTKEPAPVKKRGRKPKAKSTAPATKAAPRKKAPAAKKKTPARAANA